MITRFLPAARLLAALALLVAGAPGAFAQASQTYTVQPGDTLFRIAQSNNLTVEQLRRLNRIEGDAITVGQTLRLSATAPLPADAAARPVPPSTPATPPAATPGATGTPAAGTAQHVVEPGDTLFRIALRYNTTVDAVRQMNRIEGDAITVGQRLNVPASAAAPPAAPRTSTPGTPPATPPAVGRTPPPAATPSAPPATPPAVAVPRPRTEAPARPWALTRTTVPADEAHFVEPGETLYSIAAAFGFTVEELLAVNRLTTAPLEPGTLVYFPRPVPPNVAAQQTLPPVSAVGLALVYPDVLAGRATASGERYDARAFTLSHRALPIGTVVLVTNPATGRSTFARVNDRGPVSQAYLTELSAAAAEAIGLDPEVAQRVELRLVP